MRVSAAELVNIIDAARDKPRPQIASEPLQFARNPSAVASEIADAVRYQVGKMETDRKTMIYFRPVLRDKRSGEVWSSAKVFESEAKARAAYSSENNADEVVGVVQLEVRA
jgi:hypothetical protein